MRSHGATLAACLLAWVAGTAGTVGDTPTATLPSSVAAGTWRATAVEGAHIVIDGTGNAVATTIQERSGLPALAFWSRDTSSNGTATASTTDDYVFANSVLLPSSAAALSLTSCPSRPDVVYAVTADAVLHVFRVSPPTGWSQRMPSIQLDGVPSHVVAKHSAMWLAFPSGVVVRYALGTGGGLLMDEGVSYNDLRVRVTSGRGANITAFAATEETAVAELSSGELMFVAITATAESGGYALTVTPLGDVRELAHGGCGDDCGGAVADGVRFAVADSAGRVFLLLQSDGGDDRGVGAADKSNTSGYCTMQLTEIVRVRVEGSAGGAAVSPRARRRLARPSVNATLYSMSWLRDDVLTVWVEPARERGGDRLAVRAVVHTSLNPLGWWVAGDPSLTKIVGETLYPVPPADPTRNAPPPALGGATFTHGVRVLASRVGDTLYVAAAGRLYTHAAGALGGGKAETSAPGSPPTGAGGASRSSRASMQITFFIVAGCLVVLLAGTVLLCCWRRSQGARDAQISNELRVVIEDERQRAQRERGYERGTPSSNLRQALPDDAAPALPGCEYGEGFVDEPPSKFMCPLALHVMAHPVTCVDGHHTFERRYLARALMLRGECPMSRQAMALRDARPDRALDEEILEWVAAQADAYPDAAITISKPKREQLAKYREARSRKKGVCGLCRRPSNAPASPSGTPACPHCGDDGRHSSPARASGLFNTLEKKSPSPSPSHQHGPARRRPSGHAFMIRRPYPMTPEVMSDDDDDGVPEVTIVVNGPHGTPDTLHSTDSGVEEDDLAGVHDDVACSLHSPARGDADTAIDIDAAVARGTRLELSSVVDVWSGAPLQPTPRTLTDDIPGTVAPAATASTGVVPVDPPPLPEVLSIPGTSPETSLRDCVSALSPVRSP